MKRKYKAVFAENEFYHVYNRSNDKELLFRNTRDRLYFLNRFKKYTSSLLETYSWSLLPNHFHILVKIKSCNDIADSLKRKQLNELCKTERKFLDQELTIHDIIESAFQRFFISYSMYFNTCYNRKGNLLHRPFKHIQIENEEQLIQAIIYINANAVKHKITEEIIQYPWSSYHDIISDKPTNTIIKDLLEWFGGKDQFIMIMNEQTKYYYSFDAKIED